jgi:hypothetical protein
MPKKITAYQAEDGSIHDSECAAATRDVEIMVAASPLAENAPFARTLVEWLCANPETIRKTLEAHERACPKNAVDKAPAKSGEGPVVKGSDSDGD